MVTLNKARINDAFSFLKKSIDRLFFRIFLSFSFFLLVIISGVLIIPSFDQRRIAPIPANIEGDVRQMVARMAEHRNGARHFKRRILAIASNDYENQLEQLRVRPDIAHFISQTIRNPQIMRQQLGDYQVIGPIPAQHDPRIKLYLTHDAPPQTYFLTRLFDDPILLLIAMMLISLPFVGLLSWSLSRPVRALKNAADQIAEGHWHDLPEIKGPVEFRAVGLSFYRMIERIKKSQTEKNQLFANLSHELRTPLARISLSHALIRRKYPELNVEIQRIDHNLYALENRIQAMLALSRTQMIEQQDLKNIGLAEILDSVLDGALFEAAENNIQFVSSIIPEIRLWAHQGLLQSAIENILRNALRFAQQRVELCITHLYAEHKVIIAVCDDGMGVMDEELEAIFNPFYRGTQQNQEYNGAGLGLAIAKLAVDLHQGTIAAYRQESGFCISISLPIMRDDL